MEITVKKENLKEYSGDIDGGYSTQSLEITVDENFPKRGQMIIVVHEVIESFCPSWPHSSVDELTIRIMDGLGQLE